MISWNQCSADSVDAACRMHEKGPIFAINCFISIICLKMGYLSVWLSSNREFVPQKVRPATKIRPSMEVRSSENWSLRNFVPQRGGNTGAPCWGFERGDCFSQRGLEDEGQNSIARKWDWWEGGWVILPTPHATPSTFSSLPIEPCMWPLFLPKNSFGWQKSTHFLSPRSFQKLDSMPNNFQETI